MASINSSFKSTRHYTIELHSEFGKRQFMHTLLQATFDIIYHDQITLLPDNAVTLNALQIN